MVNVHLLMIAVVNRYLRLLALSRVSNFLRYSLVLSTESKML